MKTKKWILALNEEKNELDVDAILKYVEKELLAMDEKTFLKFVEDYSMEFIVGLDLSGYLLFKNDKSGWSKEWHRMYILCLKRFFQPYDFVEFVRENVSSFDGKYLELWAGDYDDYFVHNSFKEARASFVKNTILMLEETLEAEERYVDEARVFFKKYNIIF
jgi:hypothetical protein